MEDALRVVRNPKNGNLFFMVLILVLMEDALRGHSLLRDRSGLCLVLILVLMENALRVSRPRPPAGKHSKS